MKIDIMKHLFMLLLLIVSVTAKSQDYVHDFYKDAEMFKKEITTTSKFKFAIVPLSFSEGITTMLDQDTYLIAIDEDFFFEFEGRVQMKKLVYHELCHVLLHLYDTDKGNTIMNPKMIYLSKPLTKRVLRKLFNTQINEYDPLPYNYIDIMRETDELLDQLR